MKHTETHTDRTELIAGLNEDLAHEYASVIQYRTFASTVRGAHRPTLRPLFAREITDESVLDAESAAVARYVARRRQAEALAEHGLVVALDQIIADETRHRDELRLVLDDWTDAVARRRHAAAAPRKEAAPTRRADDRKSETPIAAHGRDHRRADARERADRP